MTDLEYRQIMAQYARLDDLLTAGKRAAERKDAPETIRQAQTVRVEMERLTRMLDAAGIFQRLDGRAAR